jgi:hypothetical protein
MCVSIFAGEAEGVGELDGIWIPGMLLISCFLMDRVPLATGLFRRDEALRFTFALGFGLRMLDML